MFSGIVERIGNVERVERDPGGAARLTFHAAFSSAPVPGASVAVNGVCLTVERAVGETFSATAVPETLRRTTLGRLAPGNRVNLERALRIGDELGGHWVQGHVDAKTSIASLERTGNDVLLAIEIPAELKRYIASKGALTVDGVSLTVASYRDPIATMALVPYTLEHTIASEYQPGDWVNVEVDILARYLERWILARGASAAVRGATSGAGASG